MKNDYIRIQNVQYKPNYSLRKIKQMRNQLLLITSLLSFVFLFQEAHSKDKNEKHTFEIIGRTQLRTSNGEKRVEYDSISPDHLYISDFDKEGKITVKRQFLFTGRTFDLSVDYLKYMRNKEIMIDGSHTFYNKTGSIEKIFIYTKEEIISKILYYPNGQKKSMIPGDKVLNGEYKLWYPTGQLSFSGNYKDDIKNGDFEQFDESGVPQKKGVYQNGKLISGEVVVLDILYENPEVPASYEQGNEAFNEYLTNKATAMKDSNLVFSDKKFNLDLTFDKTGKMITINNNTESEIAERESIKLILKDCPAFSPATIEGIPVQSKQSFTLLISSKGVKLEVEEKIYYKVDEMPAFPGGSMGLQNFLTSNLKYPSKALESKIQGKVFVNFIVDKAGHIIATSITRGVHPLLDAEALRVVAMMPKWKAGRLKGKLVNVSFTMPISFNLGAPPKGQ